MPNSHASPTWLMTGQARFNASTSKGASPSSTRQPICREIVCDRRDAGRDLAIDRRAAELRDIEDAQPVWRAGFGHFAPSAQGEKQCAHVRHRPRDRTDDLAIEQDGGKSVAPRDRVARGLEPYQPGMRGRPPGRSTAVGPDRDRPESGGDRCDRTAARTAGRQREIPRIARDAEHRIVGVALQREFGAIGLAEDNRTAPAQARDRKLVRVRQRSPQTSALPQVARMPRTGMLSLTVNGTPSKGPSAGAAAPSCGAPVRGSARAFDVHRDDGIQTRIDRADPRQNCIERLAG